MYSKESGALFRKKSCGFLLEVNVLLRNYSAAAAFFFFMSFPGTISVQCTNASTRCSWSVQLGMQCMAEMPLQQHPLPDASL